MNDSQASRRNLYPPSPCVRVCTLDDEQRCLGCGRTLDQIMRWTMMSREEQWAVVEGLANHARRPGSVE